MNSLLNKILKNRIWVLGFFVAGSVWGTFSALNLPIDAVPDITNVQVMINTKTGALDPEKIEKTVTYVIETEMAGLPRVEDMRSLSKFGLSQVIVIFEDGVDLYFARQQISQRLQNLRDLLPEGITPELAPITTGLGEVVMYTVDAKAGSELAKKSEKDRLLYLRTIQDFVIRPELKKVSGVAEVDSSGGYRKEIHINVDIDRLEKYAMTFDEISQNAKSVGDSFGGGYIQREGQQIIVRTIGNLQSFDQIANIPIKADLGGRPIFFKDVANIREDYTQRLGAATAHGGETVLGTALMYIGSNSQKVATAVENAIKNLKLPNDVNVNVVYTRSFLVNKTIDTVKKSLIEGALLVIAVLFLLLGNLRAAFIVAMAIPISMLFAVTGMKFFGISASLMSLGAIDFGLLVDGSVVMIENLLRRLEGRPENLPWSEKLSIVIESAKEVAKPVILGLFIIMVVYVPILSLEGIEGKMFHPMALTVLMALGASLLVAFFLMPILGLILVKPPKTGHEGTFVFNFFLKIYKPVLEYSILHPKNTIVGAGIFSLICFSLFFKLGSDFIPQLDEGDIVLGLVRNTDISLTKSIEEQKKAEKIISSFGEVQNVFSRMGTPESATDPMGVNFADTFIIVKKDHSEWPRIEGHIRTKEELVEAISNEIKKQMPGNEISPTQPIEMRFNEILEGSRADVSLRIFGPNLDNLVEYIDKASVIVKEIPGVHEAEMDALTALRKSPMMDIVLNYGKIARHGVSLQNVNAALQMAMSGVQLGSFYEKDLRFPVILHLDEVSRDKQEEIERIPVGLAGGGTIALKEVAEFAEKDQVTTIARSFGKRYGALSIFLKDRDVASFVDEAKQKVASQLKIPPEYSLEWGGQFKNLQKARLKLLVIVPITLAIIFLILYKNFNSLRVTALVYSSIPLAITGGVLLLVLRGIPFSISAGIGFIALLGIAILNSMVLVDFINQLRETGLDVTDAVTQGAMMRLRPVIMTALVAGLGFLPMALNTGMGAEVQRPLATVVIGGLISSTLLTLILLPTLYIAFEKGRKKNV